MAGMAVGRGYPGPFQSPFQRPPSPVPEPTPIAQPAPVAQPAPAAQPAPKKQSFSIGGGDGFDPFETEDFGAFAAEMSRRDRERQARAKKEIAVQAPGLLDASKMPAGGPQPTPAPSAPQQPQSAEMPMMMAAPGGAVDSGVGWASATPGLGQSQPSQLGARANRALAQARNYMPGGRLY